MCVASNCWAYVFVNWSVACCFIFEFSGGAYFGDGQLSVSIHEAPQIVLREGEAASECRQRLLSCCWCSCLWDWLSFSGSCFLRRFALHPKMLISQLVAPAVEVVFDSFPSEYSVATWIMTWMPRSRPRLISGSWHTCPDPPKHVFKTKCILKQVKYASRIF